MEAKFHHHSQVPTSLKSLSHFSHGSSYLHNRVLTHNINAFTSLPLTPKKFESQFSPEYLPGIFSHQFTKSSSTPKLAKLPHRVNIDKKVLCPNVSSVSSASTFMRYYGGARFNSGRLPTKANQISEKGSERFSQTRENKIRTVSRKRERLTKHDQGQYQTFKKSITSLRRALSPCRRITLMAMAKEEDPKAKIPSARLTKPTVQLKKEGAQKIRRMLKKNFKHTVKQIERVNGEIKQLSQQRSAAILQNYFNECSKGNQLGPLPKDISDSHSLNIMYQLNKDHSEDHVKRNFFSKDNVEAVLLHRQEDQL